MLVSPLYDQKLIPLHTVWIYQTEISKSTSRHMDFLEELLRFSQ